MKLGFENYKFIKVRNLIKKNKLLFYFNTVNQNSDDNIKTEQNLKKINFQCRKVYNKIFKKTIDQSTYGAINLVVKTVTSISFSTAKTLNKKVLIIDLKSILFDLLAVTLNNKIYQASEIKKSYSLLFLTNKTNFFESSLINFVKSK